MAATKTPISYLQEICVKHEFALPKYDLLECKQEKMFEYLVTASHYSANGVSSSKQSAKHLAAKTLLEKLKHVDKFKSILLEIPAVPEGEKNNNVADPVSNLLEICAKNSWDFPDFNLINQVGPSNEPVFTITCAFKEYRTEGCSRTKKDAKKLAAKQMIEQIDHLINPSECDEPPSPPKNYTIDEVLALYRKHHKWNRTRTSDLLSERHFFFEKFPDDQKQAAKEILQMDDSHRQIVHEFCRVLNIKYQVMPVPKKPHYSSFELLVAGFDCVIVEKEPEIWDRIVDYFKAMLWAC